jgi:tRNA A-37 threonylcarbamoyl transferase component Bud32
MADVTFGRCTPMEQNDKHKHVTVMDKRVSSEHCRMWWCDHSPGGVYCFFMRDSSSNGTYLNGRKMETGTQYPLRSGDELSLVINSCKSKQLGTRSLTFCAYVLRVLGSGSERTGVLKDIGNMVEDNYDLSSQVLGSGGFSQVLLCTSRRTNEQMALKVVDKKKFLQFRRTRQTELTVDSERKVMERIEHPNVVKLHETFDTPNCFYLVMEYLPGGDLLQRIVDHGIYEPAATRQLFSNVLSGIRCLHENGIVHRDIKPENILLTSISNDGIAKIADMGVAKHLDDDRASAQIQRATVCGTMNYFAPEMVLAAEGGSSAYGKAVDMWAAGVVLYIMLCGYPPFDEDNLYEQIASGNYDFDADQWKNVSSLAKDLVQKLMQVDADSRLTIDEAMQHPWMNEDIPVKRRKTESGFLGDVKMNDPAMALNSASRNCARRVATPCFCID